MSETAEERSEAVMARCTDVAFDSPLVGEGVPMSDIMLALSNKCILTMLFEIQDKLEEGKP